MLHFMYVRYRFSYAVVDDEEDDYEPEQGPNENFGQFSTVDGSPLCVYLCVSLILLLTKLMIHCNSKNFT